MAIGIPLFRWTLFAALLLPLGWLFYAWKSGDLGVFPAETALHLLGLWGLWLLLTTLLMSPLFRLTRWRGFMAVRRQLGLWAFVYLALHLWVWLWLDQGWNWEFILAEMRDLRHLQVGLISWLLLVPLVLTSAPAAQRALGLRRWQWLHRLAYVAAAGGVWHFWIVARADRPELLWSAVALTLLVVLRAGAGLWERFRNPA